MDDSPRQTPETDRIDMPGAPDLPGLSFRRYRGETDAVLLAALGNACEPVDRTGRVRGAEFYASKLSPDAHFDPYRNAIFGEMDGELVAYGLCLDHQLYSGERIYWHFGRLLPGWRRRGIGRALLRYLQAILAEIANGHPGGEPKFYESLALDTETSNAALLLADGYEAARFFVRMTRPLGEPVPTLPLPAGLEVRPVEPEDYRKVAEALIESMQDHWGAYPPDDPDLSQFTRTPFFQPELWVVAWDGDEVAGMVLNNVQSEENACEGVERVWTDPIAVRGPYRRQGLATALLARSLRQFQEAGLQEAILAVDSENPSGAAGLYERLGFRPFRRWTVYRKPLVPAGQ